MQWNGDILNETDQVETLSGDDDVDDDEECDCISAAGEKPPHSSALDCANQFRKWCDKNHSTKHVSGLLDLHT